MTILNKIEETFGKKQYHIDLSPGDIGEYVLLPGDPARSDLVSKYLDDVKLVANNREHKSYTGTYKGVKVSVTSTGMGCPSATIAMEELINIGGKCFIRIGSTAALKDNIKIGDIIISTGSMKNEGTSQFYVPNNLPAVPDLEITKMLISNARNSTVNSKINVHYGLNSTDDAFYGESQEWIQKLIDLNLLNIEMESSALFTIGHIRDVKVASICGVAGNLKTGEVVYTERNLKLEEAIDQEIKIALETIYEYDQNLNK